MPWLRIASGIVLAPLALAAVWAGGYYFALMLAVTGALMAWEWDRMTRGRFGVIGRTSAATAFAVAFLSIFHPLPALAIIWVAALAFAGVNRSGWSAMGMLYIGLPVVSLAWVRDVGDAETVYWLLAIVWATDVGAYIFGRLIGGPKLAPRISPNKTWAGLIGGILCASGTALAFAFVMALAQWGYLALVSAFLAVVAQIGDLFESSVKRRFNVKDSSHVIPGHGGVLDRVDGLVAVAPIVAMMVVAFGGGLEVWR